MKTQKRKELELQAILVGIKVTYHFLPPGTREGKINDRWYCRREGKYYIHLNQKELYKRLGITPWYSVGAKRFFDLTNLENTNEIS